MASWSTTTTQEGRQHGLRPSSIMPRSGSSLANCCIGIYHGW
jgi:hypothetical protein